MNITLPIDYHLREYQKPLWNYLVGGGDRAIANFHRRAGKDLLMLNWIAFCICMPKGSHPWARVGTYWHVFPEFQHGRRAIWDTTRSDGFRYRDVFPKELMQGDGNNQEMRISFKNGSVYQIIGGDEPDRLRGANPVGVVFSEYAFNDGMPKAWSTIAPILLENKGWATFISTPKGQNHFYDLYKHAETSKRWFAQTVTVKDSWKFNDDGEKVPIISKEQIDEMVKSGEVMPEDVPQEFYGSFTAPINGAYYGDYIERLESSTPSQITSVPFEPMLPVYTVWDVGMNDNTVIILFQVSPAGEIRIINVIHDKGEPLAYYVRRLKELSNELHYTYQHHFFPWDMNVSELGTGLSRLTIVRNLGLRNSSTVIKHKVEDGIEIVRSILPKCWFDQEKCKLLLRAMKEYTKDSMKKGKEHWASDFADAFRYLAMSQKRFAPRERLKSQNAFKRYNIL